MSDLQCAARILLVRHGEAELGEDGGPVPDERLSQHGREQARGAGDRLRGQRVAHVYSSVLAPAAQTAEVLAEGLGVGVTAREELDQAATDESDRAALRMAALLAELADLHRGETVVVVTDGAAITSALSALAPRLPREGGVPPCSAWLFEGDADGWVAGPA